MFTARVHSSQIIDRINAEANSPELIENFELIQSSGFEIKKLGNLVNAPINNSIRNVSEEFQSLNGTIPMFRPADMNGFWLNSDTAPKISKAFEEKHRKARVYPGDIVLAAAGTVGQAARVPPHVKFGNINGSCARINPLQELDGYLLAYLNSRIGYFALMRLVVGSVQKHLNLEDIPGLPVPLPNRIVQTYIGDKVRQAERLRERSRELEARIQVLVQPLHIQNALKTLDSQCNRLEAKELQNRLDAKYYNHRSLEVLDACKDESTEINRLIISVSNGFEYRNFVNEGLPYITVSEVSSGRLDLNTVPKIPISVEVPDKALINSNCVLVVRTGSIGIAVKVHEEDEGASISSHLIRLEFQEEYMAAAVAAFLNSAAGECLLHKISYGAVQPQVGQEEVLSLPVPQIILNNSEEILHCTNLRETALRSAERLITAAKLLVEALIEGNITELDLQEAQKAIHQGNYTLDRQILSRLTRKGIPRRGEKTNEPSLFPDLDALYRVLSDDNDTADNSDWDSAPKSRQRWRSPIQLSRRAAEASTSYQVNDSELALQFPIGENTLLDEEVY